MRVIRWFPALLAVAAVVAVTLAVALPGTAPPVGSLPASISPPTPAGSGTAEPEPTASIRSRPDALQVGGYVGPEYDLNLVNEPTVFPPQSKLWFNDGSWWGVLVAEASGRLSIHELDWESQRWVDSEVLIDERPFVHLDVVWDGTNLYVSGAGTRNSAAHALRLLSFTYDAEARRYLLESDFPRTLTDGGASTHSIIVAPDGDLWLAYLADQRIFIMHSSPDGVTWTDPRVLPVPEAEVAADQVALVTNEDGIVVVWTNQQEDAIHAAFHTDGDPDDAWSVRSGQVDGLTYGDDQLSVRSAADGSIYAAIKTSFDQVPNRNLDAPQIILARLDEDTWTQSLVSRVRDGLSNPHLVLDRARERVYVFADAERDIYVKHASLGDLAFASGLGMLVIAAGDEPIEPPPGQAGLSIAPASSGDPVGSPAVEVRMPSISNVTSTKQGLGELSEILVLASDDESGRYAHGVVALPGGRTPPVAEGHLAPPPADLVAGLPPGATSFLFRDSFSPFEPSPATVTGWSTRDEPADEILTIGEPSPGDPALHLTANSLGDGPRACKSFSPSSGGVLVAEATVQARGVPDSDATISTFRGQLGEIASVRFGEPGTFRYFNGDARVTTTVPWQAGVWYRSVLVLDFITQTYDWQIGVLDEQVLISISDVPLKVEADMIGQICVQSANQLPDGGAELYVDDVSVRSGPGG